MKSRQKVPNFTLGGHFCASVIGNRYEGIDQYVPETLLNNHLVNLLFFFLFFFGDRLVLGSLQFESPLTNLFLNPVFTVIVFDFIFPHSARAPTCIPVHIFMVKASSLRKTIHTYGFQMLEYIMEFKNQVISNML
jgi:hypothetical protein